MVIPNHSYVKDGIRYLKIKVDIMLSGGRFYTTMRWDAPMEADFSEGRYYISLADISAEVKRRYQSLHNKDYTLVPYT